MSSSELDSLIVQNLADLDGAAKRLHQIQERVFRALGAAAEDWAHRKGWKGEFDWNNEFWLAAPEWRSVSMGEDWFDGYFSLELGAGDADSWAPEEDYFYLTRLCQVGSGKYGFRFQQNPMGRAKWKHFAREQVQMAEATAFSLDENVTFFMPFHVDHNALSVALREDAVEDALGPFAEALERLEAARPAFDALVNRIREMVAAEA